VLGQQEVCLRRILNDGVDEFTNERVRQALHVPAPEQILSGR
jgi:hypothetical protein